MLEKKDGNAGLESVIDLMWEEEEITPFGCPGDPGHMWDDCDITGCGGAGCGSSPNPNPWIWAPFCS